VVETGTVLTLEEHSYGGLGTAVGECIARCGDDAVLVPLRLGRSSIKRAGSQEELRAAQGLSVEGIVQASELLCRSPRPMVIR
jgi:transketolase C-terminal domain/subunit